VNVWDCQAVTPDDPDVSGWLPEFLPADEQFAQQAERLRSLVGSRITGAWIVWNLEDDKWFADLPVVLQFDHLPQLELCWEKFDDLSITWDTVDLTVTPKAWVEWPLEWREQAHPAVASVVGTTVDQISATTSRFVTQNVDHPHEVRAVWLMTGLWLATSRGGLRKRPFRAQIGRTRARTRTRLPRSELAGEIQGSA
jgi:hypothetical protein